jgi:hypothetical protein
LFNHLGTGDFLQVDAQQTPTTDVEAFKRRKAMKDVPLAACYATRRGDRVNVFVLSRKLDNYPQRGDDGCTPVAIELPFNSVKKITLYKIAGDPRATNIDTEKVKIETVPIAATAFAKSFVVNDRTGADQRGLPPGATLLYVFEGVSSSSGSCTTSSGSSIRASTPAATSSCFARKNAPQHWPTKSPSANATILGINMWTWPASTFTRTRARATAVR